MKQESHSLKGWERQKVAREKWSVQQGTNLTDIRAKLGTSSTQGYSSQNQLATLDAHLEMLTKAGFNTNSP